MEFHSSSDFRAVSTDLQILVVRLNFFNNATLILQFEINKKRDTELAKLRKLLEDVHLESEETAHLLRKKHQEVVVDFQDQIDQLSKARAKLVI